MHGVSGSVTHRPSALAPRGQHVPAPAALLEGDKLLDSMAGYGNLSQRPSALGAATAQGADSLSWEGLRKDARKLEGELDMRLAAYSKLGARGSKDVSEASANAAEAEIEVSKVYASRASGEGVGVGVASELVCGGNRARGGARWQGHGTPSRTPCPPSSRASVSNSCPLGSSVCCCG